MTHVLVKYDIRSGPPAAPLGPLWLRPGTTDALVFHQIWQDELYRPVMGLRDYALIIDGGANIGMSALYFAKHHPKATVYAIEPDPANYEVMLRNMDAWEAHNPTCFRRLFHGGIGSKDGFARIHDPGIGAFGFQTVDDQSGPIAIRTMAKLLTDVFALPDQARPTLVKLDIEGAEVEVFKDPAWMNDIDVLAVELHGPNAEFGLSNALHLVGRKHRRWTVGETTFVEFL